MSRGKSFILGFVTACICIVIVYDIRIGLNIINGVIPTDKKLSVIEKLIEEGYVDDIDKEELEEHMYTGYVAGLGDKYSTYMDTEEFKSFKDSMNGYYSGIGIQVILTSDGHMKVSDVYSGSPAEAAGLSQDDIIYSVGGIEINDSDSYREAVGFIKSSSEEFTVTGCHSDGSDFELLISTANVDVPSVCYTMLDNSLGYIRITEFESNTVDQFNEALDNLMAEEMKGLIIDLRNNPGGILTVVNDIADRFLPEGVITYIEYKNGKEKYYYSDEDCLDLPLVLLVNGSSASASEVFTGAVKDYGVGTVIGTTTFGKGIVQDSFALSDGSSVKLTVAKYYTPNGVCIHGEGIEPDIEIEAEEEFSLPTVTNSKAEPDIENDVQLKKAIEILS